MMKESVQEAVGDVDVSTAFAFPHFKFVAKEVSERLRLCSLAINYIEDLADIESSLGKSLSKVGDCKSRILYSCSIFIILYIPTQLRLESSPLSLESQSLCLELWRLGTWR